MIKFAIKYQWHGIDEKGIKTQGESLNGSKKTVLSKLNKNKIIVTEIKRKFVTPVVQLKNKITEKMRLRFTQELFWLMQSGVSIVDALEIQISTSQNLTEKKMLSEIKEKLSHGNSLSKTLENYHKIFSSQYLNLVQAGEDSGCLIPMLNQIIRYDKMRIKLKSKIIKSLIYPVSVAVIGIFILIGMLLFVIPHFQKIYSSFGAKLPFLTQNLINISDFFVTHWPLVLIIIVGSIISAYSLAIKFFTANLFITKIFFKIPIIKQVIIYFNIANWSQLLSSNLETSVPLIDALKISSTALSNPLLRSEFNHIEKQIISGASFHQALTFAKTIPLHAKQLIIIGENTDNLPPLIQKIAEQYHNALDDLLDHLSKLLEPVIMIVLSIGIAGFIIAMYLPIFQMGHIM